MFEKDYYDYRKMVLTINRMEDKIDEMLKQIAELELTVKGSIDYNDLFVPVSRTKIEKLKEEK